MRAHARRKTNARKNAVAFYSGISFSIREIPPRRGGSKKAYRNKMIYQCPTDRQKDKTDKQTDNPPHDAVRKTDRTKRKETKEKKKMVVRA